MTVVLMPAAQQDLRAVYAYYAERNPDAADRVVGAILRAANALERFPLMGRPGVVPGTRERIVTRYPYRIVYRVMDKIGAVEVPRVLPGTRQ